MARGTPVSKSLGHGLLASHSLAVAWWGGRPSDPEMPSQLRSSGVQGARQQERLEKARELGEEQATASADGQLASHNITL